MKLTRWALVTMTAVGATRVLAACNEARQKECDKFLSALKPLDQPPLTVETIGRVHDGLIAIHFEDEPLREYAKSAAATLTVLASTLALQADPSAPDGTTAVVTQKLKEAQGERDDAVKYCSP